MDVITLVAVIAGVQLIVLRLVVGLFSSVINANRLRTQWRHQLLDHDSWSLRRSRESSCKMAIFSEKRCSCSHHQIEEHGTDHLASCCLSAPAGAHQLLPHQTWNVSHI
jgi:uncharacterized membrane protein YraQ (UPF0718 family)